MGTETEIKLQISDFEAVRSHLADVSADRLGCVLETNWFFDWPDGRSGAVDKGLRLRCVAAIDGQAVPPTVTFKGPAQAGSILSREELEVAVSDGERLRRMLVAIGLVEILVYQKRRESWRLGVCRVELDELPVLGRFVEIEGPDADAVADGCRQLGQDASAGVGRTYLPMLLEYVREAGLARPCVMFEG